MSYESVLHLMLLLRLNWLLHSKCQSSQRLSLLKQGRFYSVIKVLLYVANKNPIENFYLFHLLVPRLLTMIKFSATRNADEWSKIMAFFYYGAAKPSCLTNITDLQENIPSLNIDNPAVS